MDESYPGREWSLSLVGPVLTRVGHLDHFVGWRLVVEDDNRARPLLGGVEDLLGEGAAVPPLDQGHPRLVGVGSDVREVRVAAEAPARLRDAHLSPDAVQWRILAVHAALRLLLLRAVDPGVVEADVDVRRPEGAGGRTVQPE